MFAFWFTVRRGTSQVFVPRELNNRYQRNASIIVNQTYTFWSKRAVNKKIGCDFVVNSVGT